MSSAVADNKQCVPLCIAKSIKSPIPVLSPGGHLREVALNLTLEAHKAL